MAIAGNCVSAIQHITSQIKNRLDLQVNEAGGQLLGIIIEENSSRIKLHHTFMINGMLYFFNMSDSVPSRVPIPLGTVCSENDCKGKNATVNDQTPYRHLIVCLVHLSNTTRPDIAYSAGYFLVS